MPRALRARALVGLAVFSIVVISSFSYSYQLKNLISYASRPLWDKPDGPTTILAHYHADGVLPDANLCALHGWEARTAEPEVWDAVLFTTELDLLEIRWNELDAVVDKFFILENNVTFTGRAKPEDFALHRTRFAKFEHKIVYKSLAGSIPPDSEPFVVEGKHRGAMTGLLREHLSSTKNGRNPLVIFSDTDEIPAAHTIRLLKKCAFATPLHLRMRTFLYSFEWPYGDTSWRAQVHDWSVTLTNYGHSMQSDVALADAGWHCSFCFRYIDEFVTKMQGYSHADRIGGVKEILRPSHIQEVICKGKDIFNMLPEAYTYKDLISLMNLEPSRSMVGLPRFLVQNAQRFRFLLPGGCKREDRPDDLE
ncbi:glycosyltransferase family 17 protein [Exidia glandulosa HHB12029]|uniref:Glycosyltransferase family 17 protein n=1 Tax=Exidia glandulosa HHB12029 TaxID=1314781 RepID=A0A165IPD2_EXIGL|nr:glycosyltransferase family 17 protein [Exidia glandulosa HHB12029]